MGTLETQEARELRTKALHLVGETRLWRHPVESRHVHLVVALLRRNPNVLGDFEFGRRLGQVPRHDHDTRDDPRNHVNPNVTRMTVKMMRLRCCTRTFSAFESIATRSLLLLGCGEGDALNAGSCANVEHVDYPLMMRAVRGIHCDEGLALVCVSGFLETPSVLSNAGRSRFCGWSMGRSLRMIWPSS